MEQSPSFLTDSDQLEFFVRNLVQTSHMTADEMLQVISRLAGIPIEEVRHSINSNPFRAQELTLRDLISEAVLTKTSIASKE